MRTSKTESQETVFRDGLYNFDVYADTGLIIRIFIYILSKKRCQKYWHWDLPKLNKEPSHYFYVLDFSYVLDFQQDHQITINALLEHLSSFDLQRFAMLNCDHPGPGTVSFSLTPSKIKQCSLLPVQIW